MTEKNLLIFFLIVLTKYLLDVNIYLFVQESLIRFKYHFFIEYIFIYYKLVRNKYFSKFSESFSVHNRNYS